METTQPNIRVSSTKNMPADVKMTITVTWYISLVSGGNEGRNGLITVYIGVRAWYHPYWHYIGFVYDAQQIGRRLRICRGVGWSSCCVHQHLRNICATEVPSSSCSR